MMGRTICALADAAAMPVISCLEKFPQEFNYHIKHGKCDLLEEALSNE